MNEVDQWLKTGVVCDTKRHKIYALSKVEKVAWIEGITVQSEAIALTFFLSSKGVIFSPIYRNHRGFRFYFYI